MATNIIDHRNAILMLGGETLTQVSGLSDDNPPIELPEIPLYETHYGHDGTMYAMGTSRRGGEVKVKLLPTSPTHARWLNIHAQIQKGTHILWHGTYRYEVLIGGVLQSYGFALRGGVMKMAPVGSIAGVNGVWTFEFEEIIPDATSANLQ